MQGTLKTLAAVALLGATPTFADSVACHIIYGGENFSVNAQPTADPYKVKGEKIGRYFEFKAVYATSPADLAAISIYVYGTSSGESVLIHQAKFAPGIRNDASPWGFAGFQYVYEPSKSSELQYWCETAP